MLSIRARSFLETLERRPFIPTREVEAIIREQGYPCFEPWLDFHDRYAGYHERFGRDGAIWGLAHERPQWLLPRKADIDREVNEEIWYVTCADAHPSYSYRLDNTGEFIGAPAERFDVHVERIALGWDFARRTGGRARPLSAGDLRGPAFAGILERVKAFLVSEASDRFARYYMTDTLLLVEDASTGALRKGQILTPAA